MPERFYQLFFDDEPAADDFYPNVIEVEVTDHADEADTFRLKLRLRVGDGGEWTDADYDQIALFSKVRIEAGFRAGDTQVLTEGYVTEMTAHFEDAGRQPYFEVRGLDASVLMTLEEKIVAWPNLSDGDIATQILSGYGLVPDVTSTNPVHQDTDITVMQRGTDLQFLRSLARRHGFEVGVERDFVSGVVTGYFREPNLAGNPQKTLAVAFGEQSSLSSFEVSVDSLRPLAAEADQIDVKGKAVGTGTATGLQLAAIGDRDLAALAGDTAAGLVSPKDTVGKVWLAADPTSDATELAGLAQAVCDEAGWLATARGDIRSDVYGTVLRANRLVLVRGAGSRYSGAYYVTSVTHRLAAAGEYEQHFEARRNALGLSGGEDFGGGSGPSAG
jgi:phage protein D